MCESKNSMRSMHFNNKNRFRFPTTMLFSGEIQQAMPLADLISKINLISKMKGKGRQHEL
jgi:hypothetical protein